MTLIKPRGSTHGIKQYQTDVRERTRSALQQALQSLASECPESQWNHIQVCKKAGLASSAALKKPWNADLIVLVQNHNAKIREAHNPEKSLKEKEAQYVISSKHPTSKLIKRLRSALAIRDAELLELEKENKALLEQLHRQSKGHTHKKWMPDA